MPETCVRVRIGDEEYALPVRHVPEIAEVGEVTPVPGAPASVLGIRNLRGEVLAVFDLASVLTVAGAAAPRRIVVAEDPGPPTRRCALAVDAVTEVSELEVAEEVLDSPLLAGAVLVDGRLVGLLDVPVLLDALAPDAA